MSERRILADYKRGFLKKVRIPVGGKGMGGRFWGGAEKSFEGAKRN